MPMYGPLQEDDQNRIESLLQQLRGESIGGGSLDQIVPRRTKPVDPLASYDKAITDAQTATPNLGQVIGSGFAGLGQALSGQNYLDKTLSGIDSARDRNVKAAQTSKALFEEGDERDPDSMTSKEFQKLAAELTGRPVEGLSAYQIKKVLPSLEKRAEISARSEDRRSRQEYQDKMIGLQAGKLKEEEAARVAKAGQPDNFMKREIAKAKSALAETRPMVESAIGEISRVEKLNENTFDGKTGEWQMAFRRGTGIGDESETFKNTSDVVNTMQAQVARVLKSTFGGQLSDGERAYLNEVYGALPGLSKTERAVAMTNVKKMLSDRLVGAQSKVSELSSEAGIDDPQVTSLAAKPAPYGNKVKQNGKVYIWNGTDYIEEK